MSSESFPFTSFIHTSYDSSDSSMPLGYSSVGEQVIFEWTADLLY